MKANPKAAPAVQETSPQGQAPAVQVKARVLCDCHFGKANSVVTLAESDAEQGVKDGQLDTSEAAVEYALSLEQKKS